jgi:hypothetical protein
MLKRWLIFFCLAASRAYSTDEGPWIDRVYIPVAKLDAGYQNFSHLNARSHQVSYHENSGYVHGSAYLAVSPTLSLEMEMGLARTHRHPWVIDHFQQTAKSVLLDDVAGDPLALSAAVSLFEVPTVALRDCSFIHHAHFEGQAFLSCGKEWSQGPFWNDRLWALAALGCGIEGFAWVRGKVVFQKNFLDQNLITLFLEARAGLGREGLFVHHFGGYGSVRYKIIEASLEYQRQIGDIGQLGIKGIYRFYCRNAPAEVIRVCLEWTQSFSL